MGRLIDADHLLFILNSVIELRKKSQRNTSDLDMMVDCVNDEPTAYDSEKVVKQLEKLKSLVPVNRVLDDIVNEKPKELGMLIAYEKAIEIVKGGGAE